MIRSSRFRQYLIALGSVLLVARVSAAQVTHTFSNPTLLTVPSIGPTAPYGTTITVSGVRGTVTNVTVTVKDVSHGDPGQLRLILVGPTGQTAALLEGTGSGEFLPKPAANHADLAFSSRSMLSFASVYPKPGPYVPAGQNRAATSLPSPSPPAPYPPTLDTYIGSVPNGDWTLFAFDDHGDANGVIAGGWELQIDSAESTQSMVVDDTTAGPSTHYGSPITVSNLRGAVQHIGVTLYNVQHTYPRDLDILLVGPTGKSVMLMSDAGSTAAVNVTNITFADWGLQTLSTASPILGGLYLPYDYPPTEVLPAPAPAAPWGTFADLRNDDPNGVWHLYVNDHGIGDGGQIDGWSLEIETAGGLSLHKDSGFVTEGGTFPCAVVRVGGSAGTISAALAPAYAPGPGVAAPGVDFTLPSPVTIVSGATQKNVTITTINDTTPEPNETQFFVLNAITGGAVFLTGGAMTIVDDDLGLWSPMSTATGVVTGGTDVLLTLQNVQPGATVLFDNLTATIREFAPRGGNVFFVHVLTPPHAAGAVNITVKNPNNQTLVLPLAFKYVAMPNDPTLDTDGDGMPDAWELRFNLDPLNPADAQEDPDNDSVTNLQEYQRGTHPRGYFKRFLAEGATGGFFNTSIALLNVESTPATVIYEFQKSDGTMTTHLTTADGLRRTTLDPATVIGGAEFSTVVESDREIVVDRLMTWPADQPYGSHLETASDGPSPLWYLAEGATNPSIDLFYLLLNPNDTAVTTTVQYDLPAPQTPIVKSYTLAPHSRTTVHVNEEDPALAWNDIGAEISAPIPIMVERAMYRTGNGRVWDAGHEGAAVMQPSAHWFFAEGATGSFFDMFLLLMNPSDTDGTVQVSYLLTSGEVVVKPYPVAAHSRRTIYVDSEDPKLADAAMSMTVDSSVPIVAERAMWWPDQIWYEAHDSAGATETGTQWGIAEGEDGGANNTQTYILIANTSTFAGAATVTLYFEDGTQAVKTFPLAATSRFNVAAGAEFAEARNRRFSAIVQSVDSGNGLPQIVVERSEYADGAGQVWNLGGASVALKLQ